MTQPPGDGTIAKACAVLDQVAGFGRPVRFSDILSTSPYPKATLYRLLQTLTQQGMLTFEPETGMYTPGLRLIRLAHAAWTQTSLAPVARPHIDALSQRVGKTVHLAQLDNGQVLYVDKRAASQSVEMFSQAGKVGPAYCTGVGKAMLAFLSEPALEQALALQSFHRFTDTTAPDAAALRAVFQDIRTLGYAVDNEEHEPGIICVALPILSRSGRMLGAVSATGTTTTTDLEALIQLVPMIRDTAQAIGADAELWRFPEVARAAAAPEA